MDMNIDNTQNAAQQPVAPSQDAQANAPSPAPAPATATAAAQAPTQQPQQMPQQQQAAQQPKQQDQQAHPWASRIRDVAEVLAGGKQYRTVSDVNNGGFKREPIQVSGRHLGMAIALEALSGALGGLAAGKGKGPGAAAVGGMEQGQKVLQQQQQQDDADTTRQYKVAEANMRMLSLAQTMGKADLETHEQLVKTSTDYIKYIKDNYPELLAKEHASEEDAKDLKKYPLGEYTRVPDGITPRYDTDGKPVWMNMYGKVVPAGTPGAHQAYDHTIALVHKNAKIAPVTGDGPLEGVKTAVKWGYLPQAWLNAAPNAEIDAAQLAGAIRGGDAMEAADRDLNHYYDVLNKQGKGSEGVTLAQLFPGENGQPDIDSLARAFAQHESPHESDRGNRNHNPGNLKDGDFAKSLPGYAGSDGTFAKFKTAADGVEALKAMLQRDMPKYGDKTPAQYIQTVYSPDSDNKPGQAKDYGDALLRAAGYDPDLPANAKSKYDPTDLATEVQKDPTLRKALERFQGMFNQTGSREAAIGELAKKDPISAGKVARLYGGRDALREYDFQQKLDEERRSKEQAARIEEDKKRREAGNKEAQDDRKMDAMWRSVGIPKDTSLRGNDLLQQVYKNDVGAGALVEKILNYDIKEADISNRAQARQFYYGLATLVDSRFDATELDKKVEMKRRFNDPNGKTAQGNIALSTALQHLQSAYNNVSALATVPGVKSLSELFGNKSAADYQTDKEAITSEIGKAYKAGVIDKDERASWLSRLEASNPLTVKENLRELARLLSGKFDSVYEQYRSVIPHGTVKIVSPKAAAAYKYLTGEPIDPQMTGEAGPQKQFSSMLTGKQDQQQQGQQQRPAGATMKVPGSDGKLHWSDGKADLGVAE